MEPEATVSQKELAKERSMGRGGPPQDTPRQSATKPHSAHKGAKAHSQSLPEMRCPQGAIMGQGIRLTKGSASLLWGLSGNWSDP